MIYNLKGYPSNSRNTQSFRKYSWNRVSWVSSGWNVVRKCLPCRSATTVLVSWRSVSPWSGGTRCGRIEEGRRAITEIGGSCDLGLRLKMTYGVIRHWVNDEKKKEKGTHRCTNEDTNKWPVRITQGSGFKWCFERFSLQARKIDISRAQKKQ